MPCDCASYTCVEANYNPCSTGVTVDIISTETGTWSGLIEFNGMWTTFSFGVVEDEPIILPTSVLNESYTHELKLYDLTNSLIACYTLKARAVTNAAEADITPGGSGETSFDVTIAEVGNSFSDPRMLNHIVSTISTDGQDYNKFFWTKPYASDTLTSNVNGDSEPYLEFRVNQIVTVTIR